MEEWCDFGFSLQSASNPSFNWAEREQQYGKEAEAFQESAQSVSPSKII